MRVGVGTCNAFGDSIERVMIDVRDAEYRSVFIRCQNWGILASLLLSVQHYSSSAPEPVSVFPCPAVLEATG